MRRFHASAVAGLALAFAIVYPSLQPSTVGALPLIGRGATLVISTNPFRGVLELRLELPRAARVVHEVRDVSGGRIVRRDLGTLPSGINRIEWDGCDGRGRDAGTGVFLECFEVDGRPLAQRAVRLR